jgi:subtilase family serine protease
MLSAATLATAAPPVAAATGGYTPAVGVKPHFRSAGKPAAQGSSVVFSCQFPTTTFPCYGPSQIQRAYDIDELYTKGIDGTGRTIVIVDAFQNPYIRDELRDFSTVWGLPQANLRIVAPDGLTPFDINDDNMVGWSGEISLDVQWSHAIAPKAKIVLVLAKSNEDADILSALTYAVNHNLGDVISMSFGEAEQCFDPKLDAQEHKLFQQAQAKGITLIASSGDDGAAQPGCKAGDPDLLAASTPANDPGVLGIGGTNLTADLTTGDYTSEVAWDDGFGQSGGGFSTRYAKPTYQAGFVSGKQRGLPDVAYNGGVFGGVMVAWYVPFDPGNSGPGSFWIFGGTSAGAPQWSGITALLAQACGHRVGLLNDDLYSKGAYSWYFHDIITGNNIVPGIGGYTTQKGWDAVTGLGTPKASHIVYSLSGIG